MSGSRQTINAETPRVPHVSSRYGARSRTMHVSSPTGRQFMTPRRCPRCEYNLFGLPPETRCPECGWDPARAALDAAAPSDAPRRRVARCHLAGLVLLLLALFYGLNVVLIEDTSRGVGGNLPLINVPGPKFWAVGTLRRTTANYVSQYGFWGTYALLLSVAAVWLVTVPRVQERHGRMRVIARYTAAIAGGAAFGLGIGITGLWSGATTWNRLLLTLVAIELPTTLVLWIRLRHLAEEVGSPSLRRSTAAAAVAVPCMIAIAAALLFWRHLIPAAMWGWDRPSPALGAALMAYGALSLATAVAATATVVALAFALLPVAFPRRPAARSPLWHGLRSAGKANIRHCLDDKRFMAAISAVLLVVLILGHFMIFSRLMGYQPRIGFGGNFPLLNYPGLKVWGTPLTEYGWDSARFINNSRWSPEPAVNWTLLLAAGVATLTAVRRDVAPWLGRALGWGTLLGIGGMAGASLALSRMQDADVLDLSRAVAILMLLIEMPLTFLLHRWLACLAHAHGRDRAAAALRVISWVVAGLGVAGVIVLAAARLTGLPLQLAEYRLSLPALGVCAAYGAVSLATAVAGASAIASLLGGLIRAATVPTARAGQVLVFDPGNDLRRRRLGGRFLLEESEHEETS